MSLWKIENKSPNEKIKITVRIANTRSIAMFLEPGKFVLALPQITSQLDAQVRRGYINIEDNFDNSYLNLALGEQHEIGKIEKIKKDSQSYIN